MEGNGYNNKILNTPIVSFQIETFEVIDNVWLFNFEGGLTTKACFDK